MSLRRGRGGGLSLCQLSLREYIQFKVQCGLHGLGSVLGPAEAGLRPCAVVVSVCSDDDDSQSKVVSSHKVSGSHQTWTQISGLTFR